MTDHRLFRLRRMTNWQWVAVGLAMIAIYGAWDTWTVFRRALAIQYLAGKASIRENPIGPLWLRANAPKWVRDYVLVEPQSASITGVPKELSRSLPEIRLLTSIHSLQVYLPSKGDGQEDCHQAVQQISQMSRLTDLSLMIPVDDQDLKELGHLSNLQRLALGRGHTTASGLESLVPLKKLRDFAITHATNGSLKTLARFPSLEVLDLRGSAITDAGLVHLEGNSRLKSLSLHPTGITDRALQSLAKMVGLESLNLAGSKIEESGLAALTKLPRLQQLILLNTNITDEALPALAQLPSLNYLQMKGTEVTNDGFMRFAKERPYVTLPLPDRW